MALKTDKAVEIFSALHLNKIKDTEIEVREARQAIKELASNPNPVNRYEIAQLMAYTVNDVINQKTGYIDLFAEVKRVGIGEKAMFKVKKSGINAFIQAKNSTTQRSKVLNAYQDIDTIEVSARPYVNLYELASGKVNFDENIKDASDEMEKKMVQNIQATLYAAFSAYSSPNYATGSGVVGATVNTMLIAMQRLGNAVVVGDIECISKFADLTGFTTVTGTKSFADSFMEEYNRNGFIGTYLGASVVKLNNPFERGSLSSTVLRKDLLYILPSGLQSPLKVVFEGDVEAMDATNINDNTMEINLRKYFGAAVIYGDNPYMAVYRDTTLTV
jgi:hypothetical protein